MRGSGGAPGGGGRERLPLDARLLGKAIIELNIARRVIGLYPGRHHLVHQALEKAYETMLELFEMRTEITLSVAKDTLLIDEYRLDRKNPVFSEFALALSRMGIVSVSFVKGMTRDEVFAFHGLLARGEGGVTAEALADLVEKAGLRAIRVEALDYRRFSFSEGAKREGAGAQDILERYVKCLGDGTLPPAGADDLVDEVEPAAFAELLNCRPRFGAAPASYDRVISSYLRSERGPRFSGRELGRLFSFINELRPELRREFLSASARGLGSKPEQLREALEGVSVDHVIGILKSIDESGVAFPAALRNLLAKFAGIAPGLGAGRLGDGGVVADDLLLSPEILALLREGSSPVDDVERSYRREIDKLVEADLETGPEGGLRGALRTAESSDENLLRYSFGETLLEVLESPDPDLVPEERVDRFATVCCDLAEEVAAAGQYGQLLDMLHRLEALRDRGRHEWLATKVLAHCRSEQFLGALVESFRVHGRGSRVAAAMLCERYGESVVPGLFELLESEPGKSVRRFAIGILAGLGLAAREESFRRLADPRWFVRRNALCVLADSGAPCADARVRGLCSDADPRVRVEAARCLAQAGDPRGLETLAGMIRGPDQGAMRLAAGAAGALGSGELLPDLVAVLRSGSRMRRDYLGKIPAVWALAKIGGADAERALAEVLEDRSLLARESLARLKSEASAALRALRSAGDGAARHEGGGDE